MSKEDGTMITHATSSRAIQNEIPRSQSGRFFHYFRYKHKINMTFRFNFSGDANNFQENNFDEESNVLIQTDETIWLKSELLVPRSQKDAIDNVTHAKMFVCGDVEIGHVVAKDALHRMEHNELNGVEIAEKQHSDLVSGKYEGGLKIWECTYDLIEYLVQCNLNFKHMKVLDLGCGAGILGIYAFMNAADVTFQDYNKEVLEWATIPNVLLNLEENDRDINECKFYSGDWASFDQILPDFEMFDVILTSETIYNPINYNKLINLFLRRLKEDGTVYVAAKICYFGVGGGTREFEKMIENQPLLKSEVCWKSTGGIQREILTIKRNKY